MKCRTWGNKSERERERAIIHPLNLTNSDFQHQLSIDPNCRFASDQFVPPIKMLLMVISKSNIFILVCASHTTSTFCAFFRSVCPYSISFSQRTPTVRYDSCYSFWKRSLPPGAMPEATEAPNWISRFEKSQISSPIRNQIGSSFGRGTQIRR